MRTFIFLLLSFSIISFSACKGSKASSTSSSTETKKTKSGLVKFVQSETLSDVLDDAARQNKLVFVDFYTTWCLPCKLMDQDVFTDKNVAKFLNDNFLSYKVNGEKGNGPNLAFVYQVQAYPTLLFMDAKGVVIEKKVGAAYQTELMEMGRRALNSQGM